LVRFASPSVSVPSDLNWVFLLILFLSFVYL
jgi:hypothetical protein